MLILKKYSMLFKVNLGAILREPSEESCTQDCSLGKQDPIFSFHLELTSIIAIVDQTASTL
jgi:hypothetical protein